ncbi:MAG: InlB B-repeat-containing protein, partial [Lachnospiraceae bacterium]
MKKHGKKLTKRLTAFLMSFVMVMSLVTITKPMKVQAATYTPGNPYNCYSYSSSSSDYDYDDLVSYGFICAKNDNINIWYRHNCVSNYMYVYKDKTEQVGRISSTVKADVELVRGNTYYCYYAETGSTFDKQANLYFNTVTNYTITRQRYDGTTSSLILYKYDNESGNTQYVNGSNGTSIPSPSARTGYTFSHWTKNSVGGTQVSSTTDLKSATTIYENWTPNRYNVTFNKNKPANSPSDVSGTMSNQDFTYDTAQSLTINQYSLEGYEFKGWNTQANGSGTSYADGAEVNNLTATNNGTFTLYAQWETLPFDITLNSGDATYPGTKTIHEKYGTGYYLNESCTKVMATDANKILIPKKDGYDFAGYYTEQGGSGTQIINANGYITGNYTAETELYAHWVDRSANYTIQYHANGGTIKGGADTSQSRSFTVADDTFTLKSVSGMFSAPVSSTGGACEFLGWATSPSSSQAEYTDNASVSDFTDVDGATIHLYAVWRSTLPTSIQNGSFEAPAIGSWYSIMPDTTSSIAWKTTARDKKIEFARPSKNMSAANSAYHTSTTVDGYQFAELCANQVGALYQTVSTFSGNTLKWGFSHRGRSGNDTMELWIGKPADVMAVLEYYTSHNNSVAGISGDLLDKYNTISDNGTRSYTDGNTQWNSYTGNYVVPDGQFETTFAFVSIAASGNKISFGNLLDNVYFTAEVPPKTQLFEYGATKGGAAVAQVNGITTTGSEALVSVGSTIELYPVAEEGYTYNGGFVNGEYKSVDELPLRYTVSDADTSLKKITLLFSKDSTIIFDKEGGSYADDEYDLKASGNNQYYTLKANPTKEGYAFDKWIIAGSNVTLTEGNYIAYETDADTKTYIRVYADSNKSTLLYQCESEFGINLIATYRFTAFPSAKVELDMEGGEVDGETSITYELDKSDLSDSATSDDIIEYNAITLPTPTRGVYVFKGWKIGDKVYDAGTKIKYAI